MNLLESLIKLVPASVRRRLIDRIKESVVPGANQVLATLYSPPIAHTSGFEKVTWSRKSPSPRLPGVSLSLPPMNLVMGYGAAQEEFLSSGKMTANFIRTILARENLSLGVGDSVMEWGCASGRVLRHFEKEALQCEFWGLDQDADHINWAKENLSPPFKFVSSTAYPHFPFEDGKFKLVYGMSVFTHIFHLIDMWLMEFKRILAPGGYAIFTIHDENTWNWFAQNLNRRPKWLATEDMGKQLDADVTVYWGESGSWANTYTFFHSNWIMAEWSSYLKIVSIEPFAEYYQTAVVLK